MQIQETYIRDSPRGSDKRAEAQQKWRAAYFNSLRKELIDGI